MPLSMLLPNDTQFRGVKPDRIEILRLEMGMVSAIKQIAAKGGVSSEGHLLLVL